MLKVLTPIEETRAYQSIIEEGEIKANARTLQRLIKRRFGAMPGWAEERIAAAGDAQLQIWLDGIFDAASVEDLLK